MKSVPLTDLRHKLGGYVGELEEPIMVTNHGNASFGLVTPKWALLIERVAQFDSHLESLPGLESELKLLLQRAVVGLQSAELRSLQAILEQVTEEATVVYKYREMQKSLGL